MTRQSDFGPIGRLLMKHARDAFVSDAEIGRQWQNLSYTSAPDLGRAIEEYERLIGLLRGFGIEIDFLPPAAGTGLDSLYVRDASIACDRGLILCRMGKRARQGEPAAQEALFRSTGLPVVGAIDGAGTLEGGDVAWLDQRTVAVGRGYRTNDDGIRQLRALLDDCIDELIVVPLPHWKGEHDVFHLMSIFSPVDRDLALVYSPLLPVPFRETLLAREVRLVEVPDSEFESMGTNVLAVAPRRVVALSGNPETRARLEACGVEVHTYEGTEISSKGAGGPTCLTRPLGVRS